MAGFFFQPRRHQKGEEIAVQALFPTYETTVPAHETGVPCQWNSCANKM